MELPALTAHSACTCVQITVLIHRLRRVTGHCKNVLAATNVTQVAALEQLLTTLKDTPIARVLRSVNQITYVQTLINSSIDTTREMLRQYVLTVWLKLRTI